jgi:hypothetical protein
MNLFKDIIVANVTKHKSIKPFYIEDIPSLKGPSSLIINIFSDFFNPESKLVCLSNILYEGTEGSLIKKSRSVFNNVGSINTVFTIKL